MTEKRTTLSLAARSGKQSSSARPKQSRKLSAEEKEHRKARRRAEINELKKTFVSHASPETLRKNQARLRFLKSLWPALFRNDLRIPLKNGIRDEMLDDLDSRKIRVPLNKLNLALHTYCRCQAYYMLIANTNNVYRYDIHGKPVEKITREERMFSWRKVCEYRREHGLEQFRPFWRVPVPKKKGAGKGRPPIHFKKRRS